MSAWRLGLHTKNTVGGCGRYRDGAGDDLLALHTCVWRGHELTTLSGTPTAILTPELPDNYSVKIRRRDWTGKTISYRWANNGFDLDLRLSLPGPLFTVRSNSLRVRWPSGSEPGAATGLTTAIAMTFRGTAETNNERLWTVHGPHGPVIIASSVPITAIRITSHMHWDIHFAKSGARCFIVPLLTNDDVPTDAERQRQWLDLAEQPPLRMSERYRDDGNSLTIHGRCGTSRWAPIPTWMALLGNRGGTSTHSTATTLLSGWSGPYLLTSGRTYQATIAMNWTTDAIRPTRAVTGPVPAVPEELTYAGDATWEPGTSMDQCLSLRVWAPLLGSIPDPQRSQLIALLKPPTPAEFRDGIEIIHDPSTHLPWGRLVSMWQHNGDACYDVDWYNGLAVSGLERASLCSDAGIAKQARETIAKCKTERDGLFDYFRVFHDWALCSAWSDPRGWMWNADCCHNGLEGILAEARLRQREGRADEAAQARYIAARTAVSLLASIELPHWHADLVARLAAPTSFGIKTQRMRTWSDKQDDPRGEIIATQALVSWRDRQWCTTTTRNPYLGSSHFPAWNQLLRQHLSDQQKQRILSGWNAETERHQDWVRFYLGDDWEARRAKGDQEARVQAAVFYNLAPEVAFRQFAVGEHVDDIIARFKTPLNLAEHILLTGGFCIDAEANTKLPNRVLPWPNSRDTATHGETGTRTYLPTIEHAFT